MDGFSIFYRFGAALFIGMLIGLQRERSYDDAGKPERNTAAGLRTFSLLGLAGCGGAYVSDLLHSPWPFVALFLVLGMFTTAAYVFTAKTGELGLTTEVAVVITVLAGALCYGNELALAVALGVATAALLSFKIELHGFVERLKREDIVAALKFALITAIVLPVLPNRGFWGPPFDVVNPHKIWLMVVLISGIGFSGYVLFKLVGPRRGIILTGLLGGLVSSTATTLSFVQRSKTAGHPAKPFAQAIVISWAVMFVRMMVWTAVVHPPLLRQLWPALSAGALAGLAYGFFLHLAPRPKAGSEMEVKNPFELRPAITFGLVYAVILLGARAAKLYFGDMGVYVSSLASGLADVDAITLSMTEMSRAGNLVLEVAERAIVLAAVSNTAVKGAIVFAGGSKALRRALWPGFGLILAAAVSVAFGF
ncbi:MAG: MgtC/SapB family protein [Candidatus Aminicenantes bacterium]|nr:MgtC/SapB family protein [Candidatus Aminicenantes bacterium]